MNKEKTIDGVEILRFISAFAILVWHYQHFNYPLVSPEIKSTQPYYDYLKFFYNYGYMGVNFFWCISGFIFFWKYGDTIKNIKFSKFFLSRFSRLYPLHFLTLFLVLFLQNIYLFLNGIYFINQNNDFYHFFLQLFMASNWGFEKGMSFNFVIWSISIEILVYGIFFIMLSLFNKNFLINMIIILICLLFKLNYEHLAHGIVDCALFFFLGGSLCFFLNYKKIYKNLVKLFLLMFITSFIIFDYFTLYKINNYAYIIQIILYPILIFLFCEIYFSNKFISNFFRVIGNLTYSSYLLHIPVQILISIYFLKLNIEIPFFNEYFFLFYITFVLVLSSLVYKYFENPCKKIIRNYFDH